MKESAGYRNVSWHERVSRRWLGLPQLHLIRKLRDLCGKVGRSGFPVFPQLLPGSVNDVLARAVIDNEGRAVVRVS